MDRVMFTNFNHISQINQEQSSSSYAGDRSSMQKNDADENYIMMEVRTSARNAK